MATYKVTCTDQVPVNEPNTRAHIVRIGTDGTPLRPARKWTVEEVITAIGAGHVFYTVGPRSGAVAIVVVANCSGCGRRIIKSAADATTDNNLDSLPRCP